MTPSLIEQQTWKYASPVSVAVPLPTTATPTTKPAAARSAWELDSDRYQLPARTHDDHHIVIACSDDGVGFAYLYIDKTSITELLTVRYRFAESDDQETEKWVGVRLSVARGGGVAAVPLALGVFPQETVDLYEYPTAFLPNMLEAGSGALYMLVQSQLVAFDVTGLDDVTAALGCLGPTGA